MPSGPSPRTAGQGTMTKSEEIRAEAKKAEEAAPVILNGLRTQKDPAQLSQEVARQFDLEGRTAYRWVTFTKERFDGSQKRIAGIGIAILCLGFALIAAGVVLRILESEVLARPLLAGVATGMPVATAGLLLGIGSRRLARA